DAGDLRVGDLIGDVAGEVAQSAGEGGRDDELAGGVAAVEDDLVGEDVEALHVGGLGQGRGLGRRLAGGVGGRQGPRRQRQGQGGPEGARRGHRGAPLKKYEVRRTKDETRQNGSLVLFRPSSFVLRTWFSDQLRDRVAVVEDVHRAAAAVGEGAGRVDAE